MKIERRECVFKLVPFESHPDPGAVDMALYDMDPVDDHASFVLDYLGDLAALAFGAARDDFDEIAFLKTGLDFSFRSDKLPHFFFPEPILPPSTNNTCFLTLGSYFLSWSLSVVFCLFFVVV